MSCGIIFNPNNPNILEWQAVTDYSVSPAIVVEDADVEVTLLDSRGDEVAGQTWPAAMPHIADGTYQIIFESDIDIVVRRSYFAHVVATDGSSGVLADIMLPIAVAVRAE